jgi:hypothetical protein
MPILDESHDFMHPVEGDQAWSESYYFNCYDPGTDTGFFGRCGVRPNDGTLDIGLSFWLPGGGLARMGGVREQTVMVDDDLEVNGIRFERVVPLKQWRITAKGTAWVAKDKTAEIDCDVVFDALTPAMGGDGQNQEAVDATSAQTRLSVGKGHLEQAGKWSGTISADGLTYVLTTEARGNRDKSWGPRRWGGPKMWRWFSINIDDETHFGGIRIGTDAGDLHRGWAWVDGEHTSIAEWQVRTELEDDGITHKVSHVTALDKRGRTHELRADLLRVDPGPPAYKPGGTVVNEGLAAWTYNGVTGYGISEYLHQFDENTKPVVPIE